jgi:hypothetical protein
MAHGYVELVCKASVTARFCEQSSLDVKSHARLESRSTASSHWFLIEICPYAIHMCFFEPEVYDIDAGKEGIILREYIRDVCIFIDNKRNPAGLRKGYVFFHFWHNSSQNYCALLHFPSTEETKSRIAQCNDFNRSSS